jgi:hypothetical protein
MSVTAAGSVDSRLITWTFVSLSPGSVSQPSDEHSFPRSTLPAELQAAGSRNMIYVQKFYDSQMLQLLIFVNIYILKHSHAVYHI